MSQATAKSPTPASPSSPDPSPTVAADLRGAARGGLVTLLGAAVSTGMGFVLTMVLARQFGALGAGIVQQAIAAATIGLALGRLGMDTTAVWLLPRLRRQDPAAARGACVALIGWAALGGTAVAGAWLLLDALVGPALLGDPRVDRAVSAVAWALPFGSVMMVALAATRGFGGVVPFNAVGNIAVPTARPVVVLAVAALGGSAAAAAAGWAGVLLPGALVAVAVMGRRLRRQERSAQGRRGPWLPTRAVRRDVLGFGLPRTVSTLLEQSLLWLDVILVGILVGPAAAGVYGVASRFVAGGQVVMTALRIVVAPQFSARLAADENAEAEELYAVTATWIVLFGAPVYVLLACFSPTLLGLPGEDFTDGVTAMIVLCAGGLALLAGGNIQSLLLMTGRSGWAATNKVVVFAVSLVLDLALIPGWGILGAAVAWTVCMALDGVLAAAQVRRFTGIRPAARRIALALAAATAAAGLPSLLLLATVGQSVAGMVAATALTGLVVLALAALGRRQLRLDLLSGLMRRRAR
ncbi:hypothetical protein GCM10009788_35750 [Nocardioides humi]|uniref:Membrane protein involved in the export of O-antigen and teichoic acid n=1 Tax=Nocardioides humi TaxID=449461 RepID=A0ABN2AZT5_9ACTN